MHVERQVSEVAGPQAAVPLQVDGHGAVGLDPGRHHGLAEAQHVDVHLRDVAPHGEEGHQQRPEVGGLLLAVGLVAGAVGLVGGVRAAVEVAVADLEREGNVISDS